MGGEMSDKKPDTKVIGQGIMHVSFELLHEMMRLPADVEIVFTMSGEHLRSVTFGLEGPGLPQKTAPGEQAPVVTAEFETIYVPRFVRFERVDDGRQ